MEHSQLKDQKVVIIGGGLSGLVLAYELLKKNVHPLILEASDRLGGRIQTIKGLKGTLLELGATWFSDQHIYLSNLLKELGLKKYAQFSKGKSLFQTKSFEPPQEFYVPEGDSPSYRIVGGTQMLTDTLISHITGSEIKVNANVVSITQISNGIIIHLKNGESVQADKVIVCIPPQLAFQNIDFVPSFPEDLAQVLPQVQTWMAGSIKFAVEYENPFWRLEGYSGMLYSHSGIITEMYDHTNFEETKFGIMGFLNGGAANYSQDVRKEFVLNHLSDLLGEKAMRPLAYFDKVWNDEYLMAGTQTIQRPHQNNGHPLLQNSYMDGKLLFANTETSTQNAGYMEGAIVAATLIAKKLS